MKLFLITRTTFSRRPRANDGTAPAVPSLRRHRQGGVAVIVMLALLSIVLLFIAANMHSLYSLKREVQLTERRQTQRLAALSATNSATASPNVMESSANPTNNPATLPSSTH